MIKVLIGIFILSIVIFVHELGHFIAAKVCGVVVESFSIGWGPVLLRKKKGTTEYRLSAVPLGGYCGMKGEQTFKDALVQKLSVIPHESGSLFSASPFKRILIAFAGPFANAMLAVGALSIVSALGSTYHTTDNRIAPVHCIVAGDNTDSPAYAADLQVGDRVLKINNIETPYFLDIQKMIALHPNESLHFTIERNGQKLVKTITPQLNKKNGAGQVGIFQYVPLTVFSVKNDSAAYLGGIRVGDHITAVNGMPIETLAGLQYFFEGYTEKTVLFTVVRPDGLHDVTIRLVRMESGRIDLGIGWQIITVTEPGTGLLASLQIGITRTMQLIALTAKSLTLLFQGVNLSESVAGPIRITVMIGSVAQESFQAGLAIGFAGVLEFAAVICISLFLMNLLPVPVLDGGLILFAFLEWTFRRPIPPRILYYLQFVGIAFIAILLFFAIWADIHFLAG